MSLKLSFKSNKELDSVCSNLLLDLDSGIKSFAISSTGYLGSQQKLILALAVHFEKFNKGKIAIVSNEFQNGILNNFYQSSEDMYASDEMMKMHFKRCGSYFDFISIKDLLTLQHIDSKIDYQQAYKLLLKKYDVLLWDMPSIEDIKDKLSEYYPLLKLIDSLTLVASYGNSRARDIQEIRSFFSCHGISLKGLFLNQFPSLQTKRKWWEIL